MDDIVSSKTRDLWRIYKTTHEMVQDRGFLVSPTELEMTLTTFKNLFASSGEADRNQMTFVVQKKDDPAEQLLVYFQNEPTIGVQQTVVYYGRMKQQRIHTAICVYQKNLTPSAKKVIKALPSPYVIESFQESELLVNITHHMLVPKHEVLNNEEKAALLKKYRLKETQLPRIQVDDPVARYFGVKRGQVVKVLRASETAGRYASYRLCI